MTDNTDPESKSINAIKIDLSSSYSDYYSKYNNRKKRDMFYYWEGIIRGLCISWGISDNGKKELRDYLNNTFYKKKKFLFSKKEYYILK